MPHFVYILTGSTKSALYIGRTTDLGRRMEQHRARVADSHTAKYRLDQLISFEAHDDAETAAARERRLKRWRWDWKRELVQTVTPHWRDLSDHIPL